MKKAHIAVTLLTAVGITSALPVSASAATPSLLLGKKGEHWRRGGRLPAVHNVGYGGGVAPPIGGSIARSVKDFGAQGDGVTDDTQAIQAALDAKPAGVVWLPQGTYRVTAPLWIRHAGTVLRGAGSGSSGSVLRGCPAQAKGTGAAPKGTQAMLLMAPTAAADKVLTTLARDAVRGDTKLLMHSSTAIKPGDQLVLRMVDTAAHSLRAHLEGAPVGSCSEAPLQLRLAVRVIAVQQLPAAAAPDVAGGLATTLVTLAQPLRHDVRKAWQATLVRAPLLTQVGVEKLRLESTEPRYKASSTPVVAVQDGLQLSRLVNAWIVDVAIHGFTRAIRLDHVRHTEVRSLQTSGRPNVAALRITASADTWISGVAIGQLSKSVLHLEGPGGGVVLDNVTTLGSSGTSLINGRGLHDVVLQNVSNNSYARLSAGKGCGYAPGSRFTVWGNSYGKLLSDVSGLQPHTTLVTTTCALPSPLASKAWIEEGGGPDLVTTQRLALLADNDVFGDANRSSAALWQPADPGRWWAGKEDGVQLWRLLPPALPSRGPLRLREWAALRPSAGKPPMERTLAARLRHSGGAAVVISWQDAQNYTYGTVGQAAKDTAIVRVLQGQAKVLSKPALTAWPKGGGWHTLALTRRIPKPGVVALELRLDGALVTTAQAKVTTGGRLAIGSVRGGFDVDEISVTAVGCVPSCAGKSCGADGCGGVCGSCDDGNTCTEDSCKAGSCQHDARSGYCDDGSACTKQTVCVNKACTAPAESVCNDGNPCTADSCVAGACVHKGLSNKPCSDCDACTSGDICQSGVCKPGNSICSCRVDSNCKGQEDGNRCNGTLYCRNDSFPHMCVVVPGSEVTCAAPCGGADCAQPAATLCKPKTGLCVSPSTSADGQACDDGDGCTQPGACKGGSCTPGGKKSCDDKTGCTLDACVAKQGCTHTAKAGACDDGVACSADSCVAGVGCVHLPDAATCTDGDPCTADLCVLGKGCESGQIAGFCDDGDVCTTDVCVPGKGCVHGHATAACDDGDPCTAGDVCALGTCAGKPTPCGLVDAGGGGADAGAADAGAADAGAADAGAADAGAADAAVSDAGAADAAVSDAPQPDSQPSDSAAPVTAVDDGGSVGVNGAGDAGVDDAAAGDDAASGDDAAEDSGPTPDALDIAAAPDVPSAPDVPNTPDVPKTPDVPTPPDTQDTSSAADNADAGLIKAEDTAAASPKPRPKRGGSGCSATPGGQHHGSGSWPVGLVVCVMIVAMRRLRSPTTRS